MQNDTIAAIATAMSPSGIGIIRISGDDALSVIDRIYKSKNKKKKISILIKQWKVKRNGATKKINYEWFA